MRQNNAGYSLFEVLIAFAIMAMILSALIPGQISLLSRTSSASQRVVAHDFALSQLAMIGIVEPIQFGETEEPYRDWRVRKIVVPADPLPSGAEVADIQIIILNANDTALADVTTRKLLP